MADTALIDKLRGAGKGYSEDAAVEIAQAHIALATAVGALLMYRARYPLDESLAEHGALWLLGLRDVRPD